MPFVNVRKRHIVNSIGFVALCANIVDRSRMPGIHTRTIRWHPLSKIILANIYHSVSKKMALWFVDHSAIAMNIAFVTRRTAAFGLLLITNGLPVKTENAGEPEPSASLLIYISKLAYLEVICQSLQIFYAKIHAKYLRHAQPLENALGS